MARRHCCPTHYLRRFGAGTSDAVSDKSSSTSKMTSSGIISQQQQLSPPSDVEQLYLHVGPSNDCWVSHEMFAAKHLQPDYVKSIPLPHGVENDAVVVEELIIELEENPTILQQVYDTGKLPEKYMEMLVRGGTTEADSEQTSNAATSASGMIREPPTTGSRSFTTITHQQAASSHNSKVPEFTRLLTSDPNSWNGSSILSVQQLTPDGLSLLFQTAQQMKDLVKARGGDDRLKHRVLATVFYEPSTRTSSSFQAAMQRLGGSAIHVDGKTSSIQKGESLNDTIRCIECYADVIVLRHPLTGSVSEVASTKPLVNGGDGTGEHPPQALVDLFTICDELQLVPTSGEQVTIVMQGDLKHGRTVHSLAKLLAGCGMNLRLRYCGPDELTMPQDVQDYVSQHSNITQRTVNSLNDSIEDANVLYVTRIQKERFETLEAFNKVKVRAAKSVRPLVRRRLLFS
jgi:carbamoyl-phosphate synthase/aspartate carbamoyltransferase/dihydroorotase